MLDVATLTIDVKLNAINDTLSVHQLANDFPSCCWVANDNKNISGTTFDDLGGVDPFSDAPLATWEASPPSAAFAWNRIELNVTLDAATRAALLATDSPRGRFGFVLSDTQDGWAYLGTRDSRSGEISVTLYYEVVARSLERNWPAPTATPSISQAPTTRVTLTYQSRSDALSTDLSSLSDALSRWEALEAEPPTAGFCDVALQSAWKLNNPYVCADGAENDVAQKVTASFTVNAHRAGTWRIVQKFDWSHGGAYCMDGACTFIARGDNSYFHGRDVSLDTGWFFEWVGELAEGHHTFVSMGWERCCSTTAQLIVVDLPAPIRDGIPSTEWRNLTVDLLDEVYYSPSPTTPGPTAAFTPSPLPTPIPTLTNIMTYQSRSTRDWGWTTADRPEVPSFWLAPSNMNETIAAWAKVAAYDASVSTSTRSGRYCDLQLTSMWNLRNQYLCTTPEADGSQNRVASRVFAGFTVPANMSGTWEFEIAFDYSYGGFYCIDDDCTFITGLNTVVSICEISAGYHTYESVGFERCCMNQASVMVRPPGWDDFTNFTLDLIGGNSPSPTVSPTISSVPSVSIPPTRRRVGRYARPDELDFCVFYLDRCLTLMNPLDGACDYDDAPDNCARWGGACDETCGFESELASNGNRDYTCHVPLTDDNDLVGPRGRSTTPIITSIRRTKRRRRTISRRD